MMTDQQTMVWTTDRTLRVTSLTARLREAAASGSGCLDPETGELRFPGDDYGMIALAQRWALDGEVSEVEIPGDGGITVVTVEPLFDGEGAVCGVIGTARAAGDLTCRVHWEALETMDREFGGGWWYRDERTGETIISPGMRALLGIGGEEAVSLRDFDHPDDAPLVAAALANGEIGGDGYLCDHRIVRPDGRVRTVREWMRVLYDGDGTAYARVGRLFDITDVTAHQRELERRAHTDTLTKLPNRAALHRHLSAILERPDAYRGMIALFFVDLDDFKAVNDRYGHAAGDRLLELVARRLERNVRCGDLVARAGGDEFIVVMHGIPDEMVASAAQNLLHAFDAPFSLDGIRIRVRASIGITCSSHGITSAQRLVDAADRAMYAAKHAGGGRWIVAGSEEEPPQAAEGSACIRSSRAPSIFAFAESAALQP
jgi:diguanylate cyclase (GGDEF)-like protein